MFHDKLINWLKKEGDQPLQLRLRYVIQLLSVVIPSECHDVKDCSQLTKCKHIDVLGHDTIEHNARHHHDACYE